MAKLIYYNSLTRKYTQCPICKAENSDELVNWYIDLFENEIYLYKCKECGAKLDGVIERKSAKIKALEYYEKKLGIEIKGGVSDEIIEKAEKLYKKDMLK